MAIIQRDDELSKLPQTLLQMLVTKEQMAQQREAQKMAKDRFKMEQEQFALDQEKAKRDADFINAMRAGAVQGARFMLERHPELAEGARGVPTAGLPSYVETTQGFRMGEANVRATTSGANVAEATEGARIDTSIAGSRAAMAGANVAEGTQDAQITTAAANARRAASDARVAEGTEDARIELPRATLADTRVRTALQREVLNGTDPQNGMRAFSVWSEGELTWDEAREVVGFRGETSIDGGRKFQPPGTAARISAEQAKAQSFLPLLRNSHARIQQLGAGDFDGDGQPETRPVRMTILSSLQQSAGSGVLDIAINNLTDKEQQALVQANRNFADAYRFSLSGQQSSDAERLNMMLSITEAAGDDPATIAQKARMREAMIQVTAARASGDMTPLQAAQAAAAVASGFNDPNIVNTYQNVVNDVMDGMNPNAGPAISDIPGMNSFGDVPSIIDSLGRTGGGR